MKRVISRPGFKSLNGNSSSSIIANYLSRKSDVLLKEFELSFSLLSFRRGTIIMHWPDNIIGYGLIKFFLVLFSLTFLLFWKRAFSNVKVIWIAHNLKSHYNSRFKELLFWKIFKLNLDVVVFPLPTLHRLYKSSFRDIKALIIPFGPYPKYSLDFNLMSKFKSEIDYDSTYKYFVCFGLIRPYKGMEILIDTFEEISRDNNVKLVIIGKCNDPKYLSDLTIRSKSSIVINRYIEDQEFVSIFELADAVVLNYKNISNSGSIRMALTYNKVVFCNHFEQLVDFNQVLATNLVRLYRSNEELRCLVLNFVTNKSEDVILPNWSNSSWENFVDILYKELV